MSTFSILKPSKVFDAAFKALTAMVESPELLTIYGAMPGSRAAGLTDSIDKNFRASRLPAHRRR